jgi:hypothetical protein
MGVAVGIDRAAHIAIAASGRAAAATVQPWAHGGRGGGDFHVHLYGVTSTHGAAKEIHQMLRDHKRKGGNVPLGIG